MTKSGRDTFTRIVNNLRSIRDAVAQRDLHITIRTNFTRSLINNLKPFVDFLAEEFRGDGRFDFLWRAASDWGGNTVQTIHDDLCSNESLLPCIEYGISCGLRFPTMFDTLKPFGTECYAAARNNIIIGSDGIARKCTCALDDTRNAVGDLRQGGSLYLDEERLTHWTSPQSGVDCQACPKRPICFGRACPKANLDGTEYTCSFEMRNIDALIRLAALDRVTAGATRHMWLETP